MNYQMLQLPTFGGDLGYLVPIEKGEQFPFDVKRVFYVWGAPGELTRGKHAHRRVEQVAICLAGSCDFTLNDGHSVVTVHLNSPQLGVHIGTYIWGEFSNCSPDCILLVIASDYFDESEYIRDYDQFIKEVRA